MIDRLPEADRGLAIEYTKVQVAFREETGRRLPRKVAAAYLDVELPDLDRVVRASPIERPPTLAGSLARATAISAQAAG